VIDFLIDLVVDVLGDTCLGVIAAFFRSVGRMFGIGRRRR
jgi:hypothetical protein